MRAAALLTSCVLAVSTLACGDESVPAASGTGGVGGALADRAAEAESGGIDAPVDARLDGGPRGARGRIASGNRHGCIVEPGLSVRCWGSFPDVAPNTGTYKSVHAGGSDSCAFTAAGMPQCWGGYLNPLPQETFTTLTIGLAYACGLRVDQTVHCWTQQAITKGEPTLSPPSSRFLQLSASSSHVCGLRTDSTLECWGYAIANYLAAPTGTFVEVAAAGQHSCAVKVDGTLACWGGANNDGEATPPRGSFVQVTAGEFHTCGLRDDGTVECWGKPENAGTPPAGAFVEIAAGEQHTCGIKTDGSVECWGNITFVVPSDLKALVD